jgi:shikimate dehydrogenase
MMLAGVLGWPARQSLSPVLHGHWLHEHGIKGAVVPLPTRPEDLGRAVDALPRMGFRGASVTSPHKEAAFALSASLDDDARATGAVNLLVFDDGVIRGCNSDVRGFAMNVRENLGDAAIKSGPVLVLGAGGAARAVVRALAANGSREVRLMNRTRGRAEALSAVSAVRVFDWGDKSAFEDVALLVNTTVLGMTGKPPLDIDLGALPKTAAVVDIVYSPLETPLLAAAKARGHRTVDGLGMLMHQAVPAFAAWFGVTPTVTPALRAELVKALDG